MHSISFFYIENPFFFIKTNPIYINKCYLYKQILLWHLRHVFLSQFLEESHAVVREAVALPGGCVRDENPALAIRIFQNQCRCACQRTRANPWAIALRGVVPTDGILMVGLLGGHKLDALLA